MIMLLCVVVAVSIGAVVELLPATFDNFTVREYFVVCKTFIEQHSMGVASAAIACIFLMSLTAVGISVVSNWHRRRRIRSKFEYSPTEFSSRGVSLKERMRESDSCQTCSYDLSGNNSGRCPECGCGVT